MTETAQRIFEALACDDAFTADLGGDGAWADLLGDEVALTPAFRDVSQVGAPPNVIEALVYPNETAACLAELVPSVSLLEVLDVLTPAMLEVDGQIDALVAVERHIGLLQARSAELLAALDAGDTSSDGFTRDWVAAALHVPPGSMRTKMTVASDLTGRLPATLAMLRGGQISQRHAIDLADATRSLTPESATAVEARVLERAPEQTVTQFRASVKRAVLRVTTPAEEEKTHTDAVAERRVIVTPAEHGMAELWAYLPADQAAAINAALDAVSYETIHGKGGDTRTIDQRRADALVEMASCVLADPHLTKAHGQRPAVQVTVALSTLMELDDQPGELDGYGPITAAMARRIASDPTATWRLLITDDEGMVLHAGTKTYRPPADMTRTVIARDVHCVFPGCRKRAAHGDLDHVEAFTPGDLTTQANLMSLCRRHHRLKHTGKWTVTRNDETSVTTWTDRRGREHCSRPPTKPTTTTATTTNATAANTSPGNASPGNASPLNRIAAEPTPTAAAADSSHDDQRRVPHAAIDPNLDPPPF
jgi:mRNA-degrading endonuclease toxin of MazEF toxin-antitoxin module